MIKEPRQEAPNDLVRPHMPSIREVRKEEACRGLPHTDADGQNGSLDTEEDIKEGIPSSVLPSTQGVDEVSGVQKTNPTPQHEATTIHVEAKNTKDPHTMTTATGAVEGATGRAEEIPTKASPNAPWKAIVLLSSTSRSASSPFSISSTNSYAPSSCSFPFVRLNKRPPLPPPLFKLRQKAGAVFPYRLSPHKGEGARGREEEDEREHGGGGDGTPRPQQSVLLPQYAPRMNSTSTTATTTTVTTMSSSHSSSSSTSSSGSGHGRSENASTTRHPSISWHQTCHPHHPSHHPSHHPRLHRPPHHYLRRYPISQWLRRRSTVPGPVIGSFSDPPPSMLSSEEDGGSGGGLRGGSASEVLDGTAVARGEEEVAGPCSPPEREHARCDGKEFSSLLAISRTDFFRVGGPEYVLMDTRAGGDGCSLSPSPSSPPSPPPPPPIPPPPTTLGPTLPSSVSTPPPPLVPIELPTPPPLLPLPPSLCPTSPPPPPTARDNPTHSNAVVVVMGPPPPPPTVTTQEEGSGAVRAATAPTKKEAEVNEDPHDLHLQRTTPERPKVAPPRAERTRKKEEETQKDRKPSSPHVLARNRDAALCSPVPPLLPCPITPSPTKSTTDVTATTAARSTAGDASLSFSSGGWNTTAHLTHDSLPRVVVRPGADPMDPLPCGHMLLPSHVVSAQESATTPTTPAGPTLLPTAPCTTASHTWITSPQVLSVAPSDPYGITMVAIPIKETTLEAACRSPASLWTSRITTTTSTTPNSTAARSSLCPPPRPPTPPPPAMATLGTPSLSRKTSMESTPMTQPEPAGRLLETTPRREGKSERATSAPPTAIPMSPSAEDVSVYSSRFSCKERKRSEEEEETRQGRRRRNSSSTSTITSNGSRPPNDPPRRERKISFSLVNTTEPEDPHKATVKGMPSPLILGAPPPDPLPTSIPSRRRFRSRRHRRRPQRLQTPTLLLLPGLPSSVPSSSSSSSSTTPARVLTHSTKKAGDRLMLSSSSSSSSTSSSSSSSSSGTSHSLTLTVTHKEGGRTAATADGFPFNGRLVPTTTHITLPSSAHAKDSRALSSPISLHVHYHYHHAPPCCGGHGSCGGGESRTRTRRRILQPEERVTETSSRPDVQEDIVARIIGGEGTSAPQEAMNGASTEENHESNYPLAPLRRAEKPERENEEAKRREKTKHQKDDDDEEEEDGEGCPVHGGRQGPPQAHPKPTTIQKQAMKFQKRRSPPCEDHEEEEVHHHHHPSYSHGCCCGGDDPFLSCSPFAYPNERVRRKQKKKRKRKSHSGAPQNEEEEETLYPSHTSEETDLLFHQKEKYLSKKTKTNKQHQPSRKDLKRIPRASTSSSSSSRLSSHTSGSDSGSRGLYHGSRDTPSGLPSFSSSSFHLTFPQTLRHASSEPRSQEGGRRVEQGQTEKKLPSPPSSLHHHHRRHRSSSTSRDLRHHARKREQEKKTKKKHLLKRERQQPHTRPHHLTHALGNPSAGGPYLPLSHDPPPQYRKNTATGVTLIQRERSTWEGSSGVVVGTPLLSTTPHLPTPMCPDRSSFPFVSTPHANRPAPMESGVLHAGGTSLTSLRTLYSAEVVPPPPLISSPPLFASSAYVPFSTCLRRYSGGGSTGRGSVPKHDNAPEEEEAEGREGKPMNTTRRQTKKGKEKEEEQPSPIHDRSSLLQRLPLPSSLSEEEAASPEKHTPFLSSLSIPTTPPGSPPPRAPPTSAHEDHHPTLATTTTPPPVPSSSTSNLPSGTPRRGSLDGGVTWWTAPPSQNGIPSLSSIPGFVWMSPPLPSTSGEEEGRQEGGRALPHWTTSSFLSSFPNPTTESPLPYPKGPVVLLGVGPSYPSLISAPLQRPSSISSTNETDAPRAEGVEWEQTVGRSPPPLPGNPQQEKRAAWPQAYRLFAVPMDGTEAHPYSFSSFTSSSPSPSSLALHPAPLPTTTTTAGSGDGLTTTTSPAVVTRSPSFDFSSIFPGGCFPTTGVYTTKSSTLLSLPLESNGRSALLPLPPLLPSRRPSSSSSSWAGKGKRRNSSGGEEAPLAPTWPPPSEAPLHLKAMEGGSTLAIAHNASDWNSILPPSKEEKEHVHRASPSHSPPSHLRKDRHSEPHEYPSTMRTSSPLPPTLGIPPSPSFLRVATGSHGKPLPPYSSSCSSPPSSPPLGRTEVSPVVPAGMMPSSGPTTTTTHTPFPSEAAGMELRLNSPVSCPPFPLLCRCRSRSRSASPSQDREPPPPLAAEEQEVGPISTTTREPTAGVQGPSPTSSAASLPIRASFPSRILVSGASSLRAFYLATSSGASSSSSSSPPPPPDQPSSHSPSQKGAPAPPRRSRGRHTFADSPIASLSLLTPPSPSSRPSSSSSCPPPPPPSSSLLQEGPASSGPGGHSSCVTTTQPSARPRRRSGDQLASPWKREGPLPPVQQKGILKDAHHAPPPRGKEPLDDTISNDAREKEEVQVASVWITKRETKEGVGSPSPTAPMIPLPTATTAPLSSSSTPAPPSSLVPAETGGPSILSRRPSSSFSAKDKKGGREKRGAEVSFHFASRPTTTTTPYSLLSTPTTTNTSSSSRSSPPFRPRIPRGALVHKSENTAWSPSCHSPGEDSVTIQTSSKGDEEEAMVENGQHDIQRRGKEERRSMNPLSLLSNLMEEEERTGGGPKTTTTTGATAASTSPLPLRFQSHSECSSLNMGVYFSPTSSVGPGKSLRHHKMSLLTPPTSYFSTPLPFRLASHPNASPFPSRLPPPSTTTASFSLLSSYAPVFRAAQRPEDRQGSPSFSSMVGGSKRSEEGRGGGSDGGESSRTSPGTTTTTVIHSSPLMDDPSSSSPSSPASPDKHPVTRGKRRESQENPPARLGGDGSSGVWYQGVAAAAAAPTLSKAGGGGSVVRFMSLPSDIKGTTTTAPIVHVASGSLVSRKRASLSSGYSSMLSTIPGEGVRMYPRRARHSSSSSSSSSSSPRHFSWEEASAGSPSRGSFLYPSQRSSLSLLWSLHASGQRQSSGMQETLCSPSLFPCISSTSPDGHSHRPCHGLSPSSAFHDDAEGGRRGKRRKKYRGVGVPFSFQLPVVLDKGECSSSSTTDGGTTSEASVPFALYYQRYEPQVAVSSPSPAYLPTETGKSGERGGGGGGPKPYVGWALSRAGPSAVLHTASASSTSPAQDKTSSSLTGVPEGAEDGNVARPSRKHVAPLLETGMAWHQRKAEGTTSSGAAGGAEAFPSPYPLLLAQFSSRSVRRLSGDNISSSLPHPKEAHENSSVTEEVSPMERPKKAPKGPPPERGRDHGLEVERNEMNRHFQKGRAPQRVPEEMPPSRLQVAPPSGLPPGTSPSTEPLGLAVFSPRRSAPSVGHL